MQNRKLVHLSVQRHKKQLNWSLPQLHNYIVLNSFDHFWILEESTGKSSLFYIHLTTMKNRYILKILKFKWQFPIYAVFSYFWLFLVIQGGHLMTYFCCSYENGRFWTPFFIIIYEHWKYWYSKVEASN